MKIKLTPGELETIAQLARAMIEDPRDPRSLSSAAEQIAGGKGKLILDALLDARRKEGTDEDSAVTATMSLLETMMGTIAGVAGYLMARLYPIAGRRYLHHARHAIELWMDDSRSDELADNLMKLADEGVRPLLRRSYQEWAAKIRASQGRTRV